MVITLPFGLSEKISVDGTVDVPISVDDVITSVEPTHVDVLFFSFPLGNLLTLSVPSSW